MLHTVIKNKATSENTKVLSLFFLSNKCVLMLHVEQVHEVLWRNGNRGQLDCPARRKPIMLNERKPVADPKLK